MAKRQGKYYFIIGRASVDIMKSGGYKISALDVEREILALPYIAEVIVVGVDDQEFGQRVAALVTLHEEERMRKLKLKDLRHDLRGRLAGYKLPTMLRVVDGEFPKTASGKVLKKRLGPQFFPSNYREIPEVQVWESRPPDTLAKL